MTMHRLLLVTVAAVAVVASAGIGQAEIVAHYTFDDATDLYADSTTYANDGSTRTSDPAQSTNAAAGTGSLSLDGNDSVNIDAVAGDVSTNAHTMTLWVYSSNDISGQGCLIAKNTSSGANSLLLFDRANRFQVHTDPSNSWVLDSGTDISNETPTAWHHLVYVRDGNEGRIYVDGALKDTYTRSGSWYSVVSSDQWSLGQEFDGTSHGDYYTGLLDDVQIYNTALSAADALWLYENPGQIIPEPSSLVMLAGLGLAGLALGWRRRRRTG